MAPESPTDVPKLLRFLYRCPVGITEIDTTGAIRMLNAVGTQLMMTLARDGRIVNFFELLGPAGQALREDVDAFDAESGEICRERRIEVVRLDDETSSLSMTLTRLDADTLMAVYSDVSALVQQERQIQEALEAQAFAQGKMQVISTVLHDTGNAVTGIGTQVAQLLGDVQWPERQQLERLQRLVERKRDAFDRVLGPGKGQALAALVAAIDDSLAQRAQRWQQSATRMSRSVAHIQEILSIQRTYAGASGRGRREPVSLAGVIDDALAIQRAALNKRAIAVECELPARLRPLLADRTQLVRVLLNLLENAIDAFDAAGEQPSRHLVIRVREQGDRLHLELEDDACGFDPTLAEALFEAGHSARARDRGLGLFSARSIIDNHGGRLWLDSQGPGRGACAHLELPVESDEV